MAFKVADATVGMFRKRAAALAVMAFRLDVIASRQSGALTHCARCLRHNDTRPTADVAPRCRCMHSVPPPKSDLAFSLRRLTGRGCGRAESGCHRRMHRARGRGESDGARATELRARTRACCGQELWARVWGARTAARSRIRGSR